MKLSIVEHGVIYRNPLPGHRVINAFFPALQRVAGQEWICAMKVAGAMYSPDSRLEIARSTDGGRTWQHEGPIRRQSQDSIRWNYLSADLTQLLDGRLIVRALRVDHSDENMLMYNEKTQGLLPLQTCFFTSFDGGRSWSDPVCAEIRPHFAATAEAAPFGPMIELPDKRWFQLFETWKTYMDDGPFQLNTYGLFSNDCGATWSTRVDVGIGGPERSYSHALPTRLPDGRIYCSTWTADSQLQSHHELHSVVSTDASCTAWSAPQSIGVLGQTSCPLSLDGERVLLFYTQREQTDQPGLKLVGSEDGGRSFDTSQPLVVWDAYGKESLGVARTATYPSSHDLIAYGAPRIAKIDDSTAMAAFWCTQGGDTHCRWARIAIG